jgi:hypothetical protein
MPTYTEEPSSQEKLKADISTLKSGAASAVGASRRATLPAPFGTPGLQAGDSLSSPAPAGTGTASTSPASGTPPAARIYYLPTGMAVPCTVRPAPDFAAAVSAYNAACLGR